MREITAHSLKAASFATAVAITGAGLHPVDVTPPRLHAEIASVQLQALAVAEPAQILTDFVKAAAAIAGAAVWYVGFPISLPISLGVGVLLSLYGSGITMGQTTPNPLLAGLGFFLSMPALLVQMSLSQLGISLGLINVPTPQSPTAAAVTARKPAARHATVTAVNAVPTAARGAKKHATAATHVSSRNAKHAAAQRRQATPR